MRSLSWGQRLAASAFLFLSAATSHAAPAFNNSGCQPSVNVRALPLTYAEDSSGDVRAVTALNRKSSLPLTQNSFGLGSTYAESFVTVSWKKDAQGCPALDLEVSYQKTSMHIASELRDDPCSFEHVREHELHHLAIYRQWLQDSPPQLTEFFRQRFNSLAAMDSLSRNQETIRLALAEFVKVRAQHDAFDSEAEYENNQAVCNRFIPKMLDRLKLEGKLP
jgi:hypothetical protein